MRVFLDTNVLLDIIEGRRQFLLAAVSAECDVIVTRDKKRHFPINGILVLSPEDFLNDFFGN